MQTEQVQTNNTNTQINTIDTIFEPRNNFSETILSDGVVQLEHYSPYNKRTSTRTRKPWDRHNNPPPVHYYEVDILQDSDVGYVCVGIANRDLTETQMPGWRKHSFGYHSDDGRSFIEHGKGSTFSHPFHEGDTVGCGLITETNEVFFTLNGVLLGFPAKLSKDDREDYYPTIGACEEILIHVKFKPPFKYDPNQVFSQKNVEIPKVNADFYLLQHANEGYANTQHVLGDMYFYGSSDGTVKQDYAKAFKYYKMAAEQGHLKAQHSLAYMYDLGIGEVEQNWQEAHKWYMLAAMQGHIPSKVNIGYMYFYGKNGIQQNLQKAKTYFEEAAEEDNTTAIYFLGHIYERGKGVLRDFNKAREYYERGANLGSAASMCALGFMYYNGRGVPVDYIIAYNWYHKASQKNYKAAQYNLAYFYKMGIGVKKDLLKAHYWYSKAARQGHEKSINMEEEVMNEYRKMKEEMIMNGSFEICKKQKFVDVTFCVNDEMEIE